MLSFKQSHAEIQDIFDKVQAGGGGGGGTTDYTDLENKPSINSVTLTGNKTTSDLGIKEVPTIGQGDTGKILKANFNSGNPISEWSTPAAPTVEYADWRNVHLEYGGLNVGITGTYEVEYNGFATIVFNANYRDIAQYLTAYPAFSSGLEADFTITLTRDQQDYAIIDTTLYFPNYDYASTSMNVMTTNSNFCLTIPVLVGDEISMSISSSDMDQHIGSTIAAFTKLECFVQKYV